VDPQSLYLLLRGDHLHLPWFLEVLVVAVFLGTIAGLVQITLRARRRGEQEPVQREAPRDPEPALPGARRMEIQPPAGSDLSAILGTGAVHFGPPPPAVSYEPEENMIRVDEE